MRKRIVLVAFVAMLLTVSGGTWAADAVMSNVEAGLIAPVSGSTENDLNRIGSSGTTVMVAASSKISGGSGSASEPRDYGGTATYRVNNKDHILYAANGKTLTIGGGDGGASHGDGNECGPGGEAILENTGTVSFALGSKLTMTAGNGGDADTSGAGGAGGNAALTNDGTVLFAQGSEWTLTAGNGGTVTGTGTTDVGGDIDISNNATGVIEFSSGSTFTLTSGTDGTMAGGKVAITNFGTMTFKEGVTFSADKKGGTITFTNNGTLKIDVNDNDWLWDMLLDPTAAAMTFTNSAGAIINLTGTLGADVADTTFALGTKGMIFIDVAGSKDFSFGVLDADSNSLKIIPKTSSETAPLTFAKAVSASGNTIIDGTNTIAVMIGNGAFVTFEDTVTAAAGDIVVQGAQMVNFKNVTATGGDVKIIGSEAVTFAGTLTLDAGKQISLDNSTVTLTGTVANPINAVNGSKLWLNTTTPVASDVTVTSSLLGAGTNNVRITGTLTTNGASAISLGNDGNPVATTIFNITAGAGLDLSPNTKIVFEKGIVGFTTPQNAITVTAGAALSNADVWLAANSGVTGSAIQNFRFASDGDGGIDVLEYSEIPAYGEESRRNSVNNMAALGLTKANCLVDNSLGQALFDAATGAYTGDSIGDTQPGIASAVFADKTTKTYENAKTTWSILRTFGNVTGGYDFGGIAEINAAASAMTGKNQAAAVSSMISIANNNIGAVNSRIAANNVALAKARDRAGSDNALASAMLNRSFANRFWIGALGMWENAGARDCSNGYTLDTRGMVTGYDHVFGPITAGGSFGYSRGDFEEKDVLANNSKINNYAFNLYATYNHRSGFFASILGGYAYSNVDMNRNVVVGGHESASYHVNTWNIGGNLGYDWKPMQNLTITPRAGLYYIHAKSSSIGGNYTSIQNLKDYATQLPVDLSVTYRIPMADGGLDLTARGGYAYNFNNSGAEGVLTYNNIVNVNPIHIKGCTPGRNTWNIGGGVKYQAGRFDVGVNYDYY